MHWIFHSDALRREGSFFKERQIDPHPIRMKVCFQVVDQPVGIGAVVAQGTVGSG